MWQAILGAVIYSAAASGFTLTSTVASGAVMDGPPTQRFRMELLRESPLVRVTGSGRKGEATGLWPLPDATAQVPDEVVDVDRIEV